MPTIQELATQALEHFERKEVERGVTVKMSGNRPQWVHDMVFAAHEGGEILSDDWRYRMIHDALYWLAYIAAEDLERVEDLMHEAVDGDVSVYNAERLEWVASHLFRAEYVNEAVAEFGGEVFDLFQALGWGEYQERREVYGGVLEFLSNTAQKDAA